MTDNDIKILNTLTRVDWRINRRWVNAGVDIVDKYYDELDDIVIKYPKLSGVISQLKYKVDDRRNRQNMKAAVKSSSKFKAIADMVWNQIESDVENNSHEYKKLVRESFINLAKIYKDYEDMSREDRNKKYPSGFFNTRGSQKYYDAYRITLNVDNFEKVLESRRNDFIAGERAKLDKLIYRTVETLGEVSNVKISNYTKYQLRITVDTATETGIDITLEIIPAGGYNIQRFHYRWLSKFTKDGKQYKIKP